MNSRYQAIADCSDANRKRYSEIADYLFNRYYVPGAGIVTYVNGVPTKYSKLKLAAFDRYIVGVDNAST